MKIGYGLELTAAKFYKLLPQKKTHGFSHGMNFACTEDFS
jgi:hypothetical protein